MLAQKPGYTAEKTIVGSPTPTLSDAFKINENPKIIDTVITKPKINYYIESKRLETPFRIENIKPASLEGEPITKLYKHLVKAGFGNYTTPYAEYFFNQTRSKNLSYGAHAKHLSSTGKIIDYGFPGFTNQEVNLYGRKYLKNHTLAANLDFNRDVIHFYGFKPTEFLNPPSKDDTKQRFITLKGSALYESNYGSNKNLNHKIGLSYYRFSDLFHASENNIHLNSDINKQYNLLKISEYQKLGLITDVDYYLNEWDTISSFNSGVVKIMPYISTIFGPLEAKVGINFSVRADSASELKVYPDIDMNLNLIKDILILNAGIRGGMTRNSYKSITEANPFLTPSINLDYTYNKLDIYGGFKSSFSRNIDFKAFASLSDIEQMTLFAKDTNSIALNQFSVIHDNVRMTRVNAEIGYHKGEKLLFSLSANYYYTESEVEREAWYIPLYDIRFGAQYNLKDKIIVTADLVTYGKSYAKEYIKNNITGAFDETKVSLNGYIDGSVGIEYRYSKVLSAFINLNNIAATRYNKWYNYPSYRFNALGGVSYSF